MQFYCCNIYLFVHGVCGCAHFECIKWCDLLQWMVNRLTKCSKREHVHCSVFSVHISWKSRLNAIGFNFVDTMRQAIDTIHDTQRWMHHRFVVFFLSLHFRAAHRSAFTGIRRHTYFIHSKLLTFIWIHIKLPGIYHMMVRMLIFFCDGILAATICRIKSKSEIDKREKIVGRGIFALTAGASIFLFLFSEFHLWFRLFLV